jgi:hypothetical protein
MKLTCDFASIEIKEGREDVSELLAKGERVPFTIRGTFTAPLTECDGEGQEFTAKVDGIVLRQEHDEAMRMIAMLRNALRPFADIPSTTVGDKQSVFYWVVLGSPNRQSFTNDDLVEARRVIDVTKNV